MLEKNKIITSKAIQTLNKNILVSASAGAGKTKLLIDRLIKRIMVDKVEVSSILALTFTEAAASEMKHRLQKEITSQLSNNEDAFLKRQLSLIETSSISTIHSFCLSVVKDYGYVLHLDPKVTNNLLDEATKTLLINECMDEVLAWAIEHQDEAFVALTQTLCPRAENLTPLKESILRVVNIRNSQVNPSQWDKHVLNMFNKVDSFTELNPTILQLLQEDFLIKVKQIENNVAHIKQSFGFALEEHMEAWESIFAACIQVEDLIQQNQWDQAHRYILQMATIKTKSLSDFPEYKKIRDAYNKQLKSIVENYVSENDLLLDLSKQQPMVHRLLQLAQKMMEAYKDKKDQQKTMDFDDMEKFAFAILSDPQFRIDLVYQDIFSDVLVDEFQDTNDIQDAIINKVSKSDNVFRVGDIKQSIYRFRNAKPQLMRDLIQAPSEDDIILNLPNNFRSSENIVAFNNFVFSKLMNIPTFDDQYLDNDHVAIGLERQKTPDVPVECDIIQLANDTDLSNEDDDVLFEETTKEAQLKARHIAKRITQFIDEGYTFKDMCVLVRTHKIKTALKDVFDETNIPYFIDSKSGFYSSQAVQDVLGCLRYLVNNDDMISLTGILSSGLFQVSFNDLAKAKLTQKKENIHLDQAYRHHFVQEMNQLDHFKQQLPTQTLAKTLTSIYQLKDYYIAHCDEQAKINLDFLLEKAVLYQNNGNHGITRFLEAVENLQDEVSSEAIPIGIDDDVVKVMTIHQSKGLQFPIVFFWTNNSNSNMDAKEGVLVDADLGIGLHTIELPYRFKKPNLLRMAIDFNNIKQDLQEQIRLLYVALTRAESRMILVTTQSKEDLQMPIDQYLIYTKKGTAHWLTSLFTQFKKPFMLLNHYDPVTSLRKFPKIEPETSTFIPPKKKEPTVSSILPSNHVPTLELTPSIKATERGSMIHHALSMLVMNHWDVNLLDQLSELTEIQRQQIQQFIDHPFTQELMTYPMESEHPLLMHYDDVYQQGYIDLLVKAPSNYIIIDFKSDVVKTQKQLVERHTKQLKGYVYAIKHATNTDHVEAYVYSLHLNTFIKIE